MSIFRMAEKLSRRGPVCQAFCGVRCFDEPQAAIRLYKCYQHQDPYTSATNTKITVRLCLKANSAVRARFRLIRHASLVQAVAKVLAVGGVFVGQARDVGLGREVGIQT